MKSLMVGTAFRQMTRNSFFSLWAFSFVFQVSAQFRKPPPIDFLPDGLFYLVPVWVPGHDLYLVELYDFRLLAHGWVCCPGGLFLNEWDAHGYEGQSNGEVGGADDQLEQIRGGGVGRDRVRETLGGRVVSKPNCCPDFLEIGLS